MDKFDDVAIENVKKACHCYLLKNDMDYIVKKRAELDIPIFGINIGELKGMHLLNEHYNSQKLSDSVYVVTIRIEMGLFSRNSTNVIVDGTFVCTYVKDDIRFNSIHFSKSAPISAVDHMSLVSDDYRNALNYIYDVVLEYKSEGNIFSYDPEKYNQLFEMNTNYISMDQWFWHMCTYCLHADDAELLDVFRSNDINKRIQTDSCVVMDDIRIKNKIKGYIWVKMVVVFIPNEERTNLKGVFIMFKNIDQEKTKQMEYIKKSRKDILTGMWNRYYFENKINQWVSAENTISGTLLIIDVDSFKNVNDMFGHITGDEVLKSFATKIMDQVSNNVICARLGGDEFVMFINNIDQIEDAKSKVEDLHNKLYIEYYEQDIKIPVNCSIGAVVLQNQPCNLDEAYNKADKNMYIVKRNGKNKICVSLYNE